ncbi:MAG TPA: heavy-metal-associated domain-containing protein [Brumimicrobium sp.]|nr:heavy-metal-associated domain-containing protein [Brumimicrobium sp.]
MKMKLIMMVALVTLMAGYVTAQKGEPKKRVTFIQTNAQCEDCKERIEGKLNFTSGIIYSDMDLESKIVEVKYNSKKISIDEVRKLISEIGYDADDLKAVESAQKELPGCCQPGGHD